MYLLNFASVCIANFFNNYYMNFRAKNGIGTFSTQCWAF